MTVNIIVPSEYYNGKPQNGRNDGSYEQFREYIEYPGTLTEKFGLVLDDGRARVPAGISAIRNNIIEDDGVLVIHDWVRENYHELLEHGFEVYKLDDQSKQKMAVLKVVKGPSN